MSGQTYNSGLRIALLVEACAAGVGRHVIDLAEALAGNGHQVHVLYSERRIDVRFRTGIRQIESLGVQFFRLDMAHGPHPSDLKVIAGIRQYLVEAGPFDLLHCHSTKAGLVGRLAALGLGVRTAYTPHAFLTMSPVAGLVSRIGAHVIEWSLAQIGDHVICVSEEEFDHALELGLPRHKLSVVPNGVDIRRTRELVSQRASMRERFGLRDSDVCIGFVGRLAPQKEPQTLLSAFAHVEHESARLVLVGNGNLLPQLRDQAESLNLRDRVIFAGEMDGAQAMAAFDVFALPSRYEGFPYVLVEALAMGLPIISTDVGGAKAIVSEGENGFVVPVGAAAVFGNALNKVIADRELRTEMASTSLFRSSLFSLDRMLKETLAAYQAGSTALVAEGTTAVDAEQTTVGLAELANALGTSQPAPSPVGKVISTEALVPVEQLVGRDSDQDSSH